MPPTFPSHQGLVAPLWRRWPHRFDMPALCIGAAVPDVIDGVIGAYRGHLGHTWGHTLAGALLLGVPVGIALWFALHYFARAVPRARGQGFLARVWNMGNAAIAQSPGPETFRRSWPRVTTSLLIGSFSHLLIDLPTHRAGHGELGWLHPWQVNVQILPAWWDHEWFRMPYPLHPGGYPFAPHFIAWVVLGALGAVLLLAPAWRGK